jgi:hypothetical protein
MTTHNWGHDLGRVITSLLAVGIELTGFTEYQASRGRRFLVR